MAVKKTKPAAKGKKRKRRVYKGPKLGKPSKGIKESVYFFKRSFTDTVLLNDPTRGGTIGSTQHPGAFWIAVDDQGATPAGQTDGTFMRLQMALQDLPNWTDFSGLFNRFKINSLSIECIPQYTSSMEGTQDQAMVYIVPYQYTAQREAKNTLTEHQALQIQACRKKTIWKDGKSFKHYCKLKVPGPLVADAATSGTWAPALGKPNWLAFDNASIAVKHYGTNMRFQPINYGTWTGSQQIKLIYNVYFSCKGVV